MDIDTFLEKLDSAPKSIAFSETMAVIDSHFGFTETAFNNGDTFNEAGQNNGSCKLFAFAKLMNLSLKKTLQCFGDYYREDVLQNPEGNDHQNIRNFIKHGWEGIEFQGKPLKRI